MLFHQRAQFLPRLRQLQQTQHGLRTHQAGFFFVRCVFKRSGGLGEDVFQLVVAQCQTCGRREFVYLENRRRAPVSLCGRNAVQLHENARPLDLQELAARLRPLGNVRVNEFALRLSVPKYDVTFFPDGRAIVKGTTDVGVARSVYAQLIGS